MTLAKHNGHDLVDELAQHGKNHAPIPVSTMYENGIWTVFAEARFSRGRCFDIETRHPDLNVAIKNALTQLRRNIA